MNIHIQDLSKATAPTSPYAAMIMILRSFLFRDNLQGLKAILRDYMFTVNDYDAVPTQTNTNKRAILVSTPNQISVNEIIDQELDAYFSLPSITYEYVLD